MRTVVAGGTGFLGEALCAALQADGHEVVVLTRNAGQPPFSRVWQPDGSVGPWAEEIDRADAVVNLAGESISRRWTARQKVRIRQSRLLATRSLAAAITGAATPPAVFLSASGVGYYGARGEEIVTEETPPGRGFFPDLAREWEAEALMAARGGTRVALVRSGVVLAGRGGALAEMARPFRFFAGGPMGSGRQYLPWIHLEDWVALVRWMLARPDAAGPFNATAPAPVTNEEFTHALARALHRPAMLRAPAFALKLLLGEMAGPLLLTGQRAVPARATAMGFTFTYPILEEALEAIFSGPARR